MDAYGIAKVVDLRSPSEVAAAPNPFRDPGGPAYVNVAIVDDANMRRLGEAADMFERYLMMLERRSEAFRDVFNAVAEADGAVLFHCFAGKDRTGLVAAMLLSLAGVPDEHIGADFAETDVQLAAKYDRWISEAAPERKESMRDELRCPPERILGVLDHLRRNWGGVAGYLEAAGVPAASIDQVASLLS